MHKIPSELSGGQKRRLSLSCALLCDSKVIYLDEPTTGVDVSSARTIWQTLIDNRKGRCIVITTHSMEEASSIADQICIYAAGKVMCCGSQLYLKQEYGVGYSLSCNKIQTAEDDTLEPEVLSPLVATPEDQRNVVVAELVPDSQKTMKGMDAAVPTTKSGTKIYKHITEKYPFCTLASDTAGDISFKLPLNQAAVLPDMLDDLELSKDFLGIATYGLGVTSLTEVFLTATQGNTREDAVDVHMASDGPVLSEKDARKQKKKQRIVDETWGQTGSFTQDKTDAEIFFRHFWALFVKRWHQFKRDRKAALFQLLYPGIVLLAGMLALKFAVTKDFPTREMSATLYPKNSLFNLANVQGTAPSLADVYDSVRDVATTDYNHRVEDVPIAANVATLDDMQLWLNDTYFDRKYKDPRFGSLLVTDAANIPSTDRTVAPKMAWSLHFNSTAPDSIPAYSNMFSNSLLSMVNPAAKITTTSAPLPKTKRELTFAGSSAAFIICIAMSFVPASFATAVVRERTDKVKHLQFVSGVSNTAYWIATMAWDVCNFVLSFILFIIILFSFDLEPIMEPAGIVLTIVTLWLYVLASLPFTYCISFLFTSHTAAQNMTLLINFLASVVLLILSVLLTMIESTRDINKILRFFYRLLPAYALGDVFAMMMVRKNIYPESKTAWEMHIAGWDLIFFVIDFVIWAGLLVVFEHMSSNNTLEWLMGGCKSISATDDAKFADPEEDSDVKEMRQDITAGKYDDAEKYPVVVRGLRKVYPQAKEPFLAVANVFFALQKGHILGLLGPSGSGKSTILMNLTSDIYPSAGSGDATISGYSLLTESEKIRHTLGYVPQFDALLPLLTAREHFELYAAIKCVPKDKIPGYTNYLLEKLGLIHLANRPTGALSGGNRRKVSLGLALVGSPRILIIDEVSSGIDPNSRRILWKLIGSIKNSSIILTTHNLEEAEALSTKIAIMASGRIRCYGDSLHLKNKFGKGLQIEIEVEPGAQTKAGQWFGETFPEGLERIEEYRTTLRYAIPSDVYKMSSVFRTLEQAKVSNQYGILTYSVSITSLDQIFIQFVKEDNIRREKNGGVRT